MTLVCLAIVCWILSAALAAAGLVGVWRTAVSEARRFRSIPSQHDGPDVNIDEDWEIKKTLKRNLLERPALAARDFLMLGAGIGIGLVGNVLSVI